MEYLLDTGDLTEIRRCNEIFPITGVTSNPSILKSEGNVPFFGRLKEIRKIIGMEKTLHVQVTGVTCEEMLKEADAILDRVDEKVLIKIPTTEEGLKAIQCLKRQKIGVTATAVYNKIQGYLGIAAGADYLAPYCNRMATLDIDFRTTIESFRTAIDDNGAATKILAASFHCIEQVNDAFASGSHAVTVSPGLLHEAMRSACTERAIAQFTDDWVSVRGNVAIYDLKD